jgi:hypothetical protein
MMSFRLLSSTTTLGLVALFTACSDPGTNLPGTGGTGAGASGGTGAGASGGTGAGASGGTAGGSAGGAGGTAGAGTGGTTGGTAGSTGGGGAGGSGGGASGPVSPTEASGVYTWSYGDVVFAVNAMVAGRVVTYTKGGVSALDATSPHATNYGSTFWVSPQTWAWPPAPAMDSAPYTATLEGTTLVLQGPALTSPAVSIGKRFSVDATCDCVEIVYSIKNESTAALKVAPWEITRVDSGGITFFPAPAAVHKTEGGMTVTYDATNQITWFDWAAQASDKDPQKIYQDGTTWVAHAQAPSQGSLLLVKTFEDVPASAQVPDPPRAEGQIEVYTNGTAAASTYVEVENQGAYVELAAGASLTYPVKWYLRTIPSTVTVASGDMTLYTFAAGVASGVAPLAGP